MPEPAPFLFPVFLKLAGRRVLLVGGGTVACGKLRGLLDAGACVSVVAPELRDEIALAPVTLLRRGFEDADVDGAFFVVAAATPQVNRRVGEACAARDIWLNAVDQPEVATVYTGGVVRRGGVTLAFSTEGRAPALAGLLREALEGLLPEQLEAWVAEAEELRRRQKAAGAPMQDRRPQLLEALVRLHSEAARAS